MLTWRQRYRVRDYVRSSLWIGPLSASLLAMLVHRAVWTFDEGHRWVLFGFTPGGARAMVGAITSSMLIFVVFLLTMLLLVVQMSEAQLSPRFIAMALRQRASKVSLGVFVFAYVFSLGVGARIGDRVPQLPVLLTAAFSVVSIGLFLYLVERMGKSMRPISVVATVAAEGSRVVEHVYPVRLGEAGEQVAVADGLREATPSRTVRQGAESGVLVAFDARGLAEVARKAGCVLRLVPEVGDLVAPGDPLFQVCGGTAAVDEREVRERVAFGSERTLHQDPAFALRIIVDVAAKALSPAVNDPTTAVVAIDQVHRLLHTVGTRDLGDGRVLDRAGRLRLVFSTPNWEDFVWLGVAEIRLYGAGSVQVMRRLRALLENLLQVLPAHRAPALREHLALLDRAVERGFSDPEDRAFAHTADYQGIGGTRRGQPRDAR